MEVEEEKLYKKRKRDSNSILISTNSGVSDVSLGLKKGNNRTVILLSLRNEEVRANNIALNCPEFFPVSKGPIGSCIEGISTYCRLMSDVASKHSVSFFSLFIRILLNFHLSDLAGQYLFLGECCISIKSVE
jgi:hypothetical protein